MSLPDKGTRLTCSTARFFYLQKLSFGARVEGQTFGTATTTGPRLNLLAELAGQVDGAMLISLNDHPDVRAVFDGLHMEALDIRYTVGGGEGSAASELLIWNDHCEQRRSRAGNLEMF